MSALAPPHTEPTPQPAVGIFWRVAGALVVDRTPLSCAEPYGECLTHGPGHYERWEAWQRLGTHGLREHGYPKAVLITEYDDWPRGRVVYEVPSARFVLYADRRLQQPATLAALRTVFGLDAVTVIVRGDPHYR